MTTPPVRPALGPSGLAVLLAGLLLPGIDFSIVNVALGDIARTLHADETALELMGAAYGLAFAVCLACGGRLGDNYGRRRMFRLGVLLFGLASLGCGLANTVPTLLIARGAQGAAAALLVPQILATIHVSLSGRAHARAIGLYGSIGGIAFIVGQVLGGALIAADIGGLGWRNVFLVNLPLCLAILLGTGHRVPETRRDSASRMDLLGMLLLSLLLLCLLLPLALGPLQHWAWPYPALPLLALPLGGWLWHSGKRLERAGAVPLLPPSLLRLASMRFGLLIAALFFSCWSGFMFVMAVTLQTGAGLSPAACGQLFIPLGVAFFCGALYSTRLVNRVGHSTTLLMGCAIQMCGLLAVLASMRQVWPQPGLWNLAPALSLVGIGQALIVSCFFRIGLSDVPTAQAGAGSAMLSTVHQAALGMGSAVLGSVFCLALQGGARLGALDASIEAELLLMSLLVLATLRWKRREARRRRMPATHTCGVCTATAVCGRES